MKVLVVTVALSIGAGAAHAQQIADGSGASLPEHERIAVVTMIAERLSDPQSAKLTRLTRGRGVGVCGYVEARNPFGGPNDLRPFYANPSMNLALVDPTEAEVDRFSKEDLSNYRTVQPVLEANCQDAAGRPIMGPLP